MCDRNGERFPVNTCASTVRIFLILSCLFLQISWCLQEWVSDYSWEGSSVANVILCFAVCPLYLQSAGHMKLEVCIFKLWWRNHRKVLEKKTCHAVYQQQRIMSFGANRLHKRITKSLRMSIIMYCKLSSILCIIGTLVFCYTIRRKIAFILPVAEQGWWVLWAVIWFCVFPINWTTCSRIS